MCGGGVLYAILNNDVAGAIFAPYSVYLKVLLAVLFFYFLKYVWDENIAVFTTLLFPFYSHWKYFGMGMFVYLAIEAYMKKNSYIRAAILWFAFIWCAVYRLDMGFAYGFSCIISLMIYIILYRNWEAAKKLIITLTGWIIFGIVIWFGICNIKGINSISRLGEFLMLSMSNQNWAYETIGDTGNTVFAWMYIIIPFTVVICLIYVIFSKRLREQISVEKWMLLIFVGLSYFGNFSRGLVRHSLVEMHTIIITWTAYMFLAVCFSCLKNNEKVFLPILTALILCNLGFVQKENFTEKAIADSAISRTGGFTDSWTCRKGGQENSENVKTYWEQVKEGGKSVIRAKWNINFDEIIYPCKLLMDTLLEDDETFIDFSSKTFIYSAINRKNPAYVSQSPLQLSGDYTQKRFLEEIEGVPLVLMPSVGSSLDSVPDLYRYYKIGEYIYQNYFPFCKVEDSYEIWCLTERYGEMRKKAKQIVQDENDYQKKFMFCNDLTPYNCELRRDFANFQMTIISGDKSSGIEGLQEFIDIEKYSGKYMLLSVDYSTNIAGNMKVFYTTNEREEFTDYKAIVKEIEGNGTVKFLIPVTDYTRLKLTMPEASVVNISSFKVKSPFEMFDYEEMEVTKNDMGKQSSFYMEGIHNYTIFHLPRLWAEKDRNKAINNTVISELRERKGIFIFDRTSVHPDINGNYLWIKAAYDGADQENYYSDDETVDVTVKLGLYENGVFEEKYLYTITLKEGYHDYLIRVSNDYYWYLKEINAVYIESDNILHNVSMKILEGD